MPHEPSDSCLPLQPADRRCRCCRAVKRPEELLDRADTPTGCCTSCWRGRAAVGRCYQQRTLRRVARRAEAGYRALLAQHTRQGGGGDAA